ncbi:MAG: hypothetical protein QM582_15680 [Micropruina sp.]|uniref:DUF6716 putative glycosyltransferase n=1 Tax=Micropruina sp. TaxID=2737536 RepID=UPI0039E5AFFB
MTTPGDTLPAPRVLVLADTDSRWKWGLLTARQLFPASTPVGMLLSSTREPSQRQLADTGVGLEPTPVSSVPEFVTLPELDAADAVVLALPGGAVQAVLHGLARRWPKPGRRPLVISGYVGVVYEKHAEGLLLRAGSDVILANCTADAESFRSMLSGSGAAGSEVLPTVLPFLGEPDSARSSGKPFTVTFAAQPGVPGPRVDRELVMRRLIRHASLHPERTVLLKVRGQVGEHTTHREDHPYQLIGPRIGVPKPSNLQLVHGNMGEVLDRTDLLVTVSSTAAIESMHRGIPTAILTDFGIKERLGNHYFIGSGCLTDFAELDAGALPVVDAEWARSHGIGASDVVEQARERLGELLGRDVRQPLRPFYTMGNASGMLPTLLGRYGLTGHGHALDADDDRLGDLQLAVRSVIARAARTTYRQGVDTVAPALRRLARL